MSSRFHFLRLVRVAGLFLAMLAMGGSAGRAQNAIAPAHAGSPKSLSPAIIAERPDAMQGYNIDPQLVRAMVNRCLLTLTSSSDISTAWTRLGITPSDVVGIKISTEGGPYMCTHRALVKAICDGLESAGVPSTQIIIWDKFGDKMTAAGYAPRTAANGQPAIASIVPSNNYDPDSYYGNWLRGSLIWGDYQFGRSLNSPDFDSDTILGRTYYTKLVTQTCTRLIDMPVLNYNERFGIDGCLSNMALGSADNNRRFLGAPFFGDPWIDEIYDQSFIKRKVVVHILDALVAQCAGGPVFNPQYCAQFGAIYVGRDPVAIDSLALPRLEKMRRDLNVVEPGHTSSYLTSASVLGLGTTDRRRIQFLRVR